MRDYRTLFMRQGGKCAICKVAPPGGVFRENEKATLCVDHDHATGEVRGLLCGQCNTGLGMFRDNPANLQRAIEYLGGEQREAKKPERAAVKKRLTEIQRRKDLKRLIAAQRRDQRETMQRFDNATERWS